jgi:pimeloyl-ACP methyl ester carboxylesterase
MTDTRIHRAVSADGVTIAGRVLGDGPALVLVHGGIGDGETAWDAMLPHLTDRFTCYLPSTRGRGLSSDDPDHSPPRLEDDVTAFVDSIGEPVHLVGWSGSGAWVLGAAARSDAVAAVAVYEPTLIPLMSEDDLAETLGTMHHVGAAAADGGLVDAVRVFTSWICTEEETAALTQTTFDDVWALRVPAMLRFVQQDGSYEGPRSTDPEALARVTVPLLVLTGQKTRLRSFFTAVAEFIAQHVAGSQVWELPGAGHFAPVLAPQSVADELITFFEALPAESARPDQNHRRVGAS